MASKPFDIRSLSKYLNGQSADDFNRFLEKVPQNAGKTALIAGGIAWAAVAALGLFSMLQTQKLTELRGQLQASESLKPIVPIMTMTAIPGDDVKAFIEKIKSHYPDLILNNNNNVLTIQSKSTASYAQFREILGYITSGGAGWKVSVNSICVGRECPSNAIDASLRIEKIKIDKPVIEETKPADSAPAPAPS